MILAILARPDCDTIHPSWGQILYFCTSEMLKYKI
jgi:hypothetical protein